MRRHRFMESSDFNGAAQYIYEILVKEGSSPERVTPRFILLDVDESTPGEILTSYDVPHLRHDVADIIMNHGGGNAGMAAAFQYLLGRPSNSSALACFVCSAARGGLTALRQVAIRVDIASTDTLARAIFQAERVQGGPVIAYNPPRIRLHHAWATG
ncbi:hypothetical protein [Paucibacter soli]|uniref:hypothetical protein n=1 Tax=Paucibacter soli TaxID=3133433 RepID=UPI0030A0BCE2